MAFVLLAPKVLLAYTVVWVSPCSEIHPVISCTFVSKQKEGIVWIDGWMCHNVNVVNLSSHLWGSEAFNAILQIGPQRILVYRWALVGWWCCWIWCMDSCVPTGCHQEPLPKRYQVNRQRKIVIKLLTNMMYIDTSLHGMHSEQWCERLDLKHSSMALVLPWPEHSPRTQQRFLHMKWPWRSWIRLHVIDLFELFFFLYSTWKVVFIVMMSNQFMTFIISFLNEK